MRSFTDLPVNLLTLVTSQIDALYECCNAFYQRQGDDASTVSCPKASLLRYIHRTF